MRIVIIGGTGHVGTYLVPRLVSAGHEVVCLSRAQRQPYHGHPAWNEVEIVTIDRNAAEQDGTDPQDSPSELSPQRRPHVGSPSCLSPVGCLLAPPRCG